MSKPEFFIVKSVHAGEVIDEIIDMVDRQSGRHTAQNKRIDRCGGDLPIAECSTVSELNKMLLNKVLETASKPHLAIDVNYDKLGERTAVEMTCDECSMSCHAMVRVIDGMANERTRYMFEDLEKTDSPFKDKPNAIVSEQPVIPTSFEGEYYKLEPGQLA